MALTLHQEPSGQSLDPAWLLLVRTPSRPFQHPPPYLVKPSSLFAGALAPFNSSDDLGMGTMPPHMPTPCPEGPGSALFQDGVPGL